jgi:3-oxoacyl-[acyl-carrier protein] reductase
MAVARGRVVLVTGSSRGLGAAIARRLARDGLAVAVNGPPVNGPPGDDQVAAVADGAGFITGQRIIVDGGRSLGS